MQPVKLTEVTEDRYMEMLEVLPPACWLGGDFVVGEPYTHRDCEVSNGFAPAFSAYFEKGGKYFEADRPLTVKEFKHVRVPGAGPVTEDWAKHSIGRNP